MAKGGDDESRDGVSSLYLFPCKHAHSPDRATCSSLIPEVRYPRSCWHRADCTRPDIVTVPLLPLAGPVSWRNYAAFTLVTMNHVQSPYGEISDTSQRTSSKPATHLSTCPSDPATPLIPPLYRNPVLEPVRPENSDHRHHQSIPSPPHRCGRLARSSAKSERGMMTRFARFSWRPIPEVCAAIPRRWGLRASHVVPGTDRFSFGRFTYTRSSDQRSPSR